MSLSGADLFMLVVNGTDEGVVKIELPGLYASEFAEEWSPPFCELLLGVRTMADSLLKF